MDLHLSDFVLALCSTEINSTANESSEEQDPHVTHLILTHVHGDATVPLLICFIWQNPRALDHLLLFLKRGRGSDSAR
jgi:hypothetical protein